MARKKQRNRYRTPNDIQNDRGNDWYTHYFTYLSSLAYQLFEWKNLPASVDPRFMEMMLHMQGHVAFYKDEHLGYIACQGALGGEIDHYLNPTTFQAVSPQYNKRFPLYNYSDMKEEGMGVIIWNNDYHFSTIPSLKMFATDLAELKEIIHVNQNAQKTPVTLTTSENNLLSTRNIYSNYEGNAPVIIVDDSFQPDSIKVLKTEAPYVVDKLNTQKNAVWNEVMTYLGINNANLEKKERMITSEAESNNEQVDYSGSVFLKPRKEACKRINELYGLNLEVDYREDTIRQFQNMSNEGMGDYIG